LHRNYSAILEVSVLSCHFISSLQCFSALIQTLELYTALFLLIKNLNFATIVAIFTHYYRL